MTSNRKNFAVFAVTIVVLSLCYAALEFFVGSSSDGLHLLLRVSGRVSLLNFLAIFIARPLRELAAWPSNSWLLRNRCYLGISFAASHTVHLSIIIWLWPLVPEKVFPLQTLIVGGGGFVLMYLMLITSFDRPARAIGRKYWRRLHKVGLYWIGFIFAFDFFIKPLSQPSFIPYLPLSILVLLAIVVRVIAWRSGRRLVATQ